MVPLLPGGGINDLFTNRVFLAGFWAWFTAQTLKVRAQWTVHCGTASCAGWYPQHQCKMIRQLTSTLQLLKQQLFQLNFSICCFAGLWLHGISAEQASLKIGVALMSGKAQDSVPN
jgi:hypothetical protein